jgi:hypothetical protein
MGINLKNYSVQTYRNTISISYNIWRNDGRIPLLSTYNKKCGSLKMFLANVKNNNRPEKQVEAKGRYYPMGNSIYCFNHTLLSDEYVIQLLRTR